MKKFSFLMLLISGLGFSMPPHPSIITNSIFLSQVKGYAAKKLTTLGITKREYSPQKTTKTSGNIKFPVLLIQFTDLSNESVSTTTFFSNLLNGTNENQLSLKKYYYDMSGGKLNLTLIVYGIYTSKSNYQYYGKNDYNGDDLHAGELVGEAIDMAISNGVDFSQFDNDSDGRVDGVIVIHAGMGEEVASTNADYIWSHRWSLSEAKDWGDGSGPRTNNGKVIDDYTIQPEYIENPGDSAIGVFAHELGHIFGLPDLYDTSYLTHGVGDWSLMSYGAWLGPKKLGEQPAPLLSWEKARLGWITVEEPLLIAGLKDSFSYIAILISIITYIIFEKFKKEKLKALKRLFIMFSLFSLFNLSCFLFPDNKKTDSDKEIFEFPIDFPHMFTIIELTNIEESKKAIKVTLPDPSGRQYLLIENKVKIPGTWTEYLPGEGLLILRINENFTTDYYMSNNIVNAGLYRIHGVEVVEADGTNGFDLRKRVDYGSSNDTFYYGNNDRLTPDSNPPMIYFTSTTYSSSNKAYIYIENITSKSNIMSFTLR
ncbi:MAG: M6 family metalloprotease domain-containing protein [Brevinematia bacterium]